MTIEVFDPDPPPSPGTSRKPEMKLLTAEFGDGYSQISPDGINHLRKTMRFKWELLTTSQERAIDAFLTRHGGHLPFYYAPSDETVSILWTCQEWESRVLENGFREMDATFKQSFNIVA